MGKVTPLSFVAFGYGEGEGQHPGEVHRSVLVGDQLPEAGGVEMKEPEPDGERRNDARADPVEPAGPARGVDLPIRPRLHPPPAHGKSARRRGEAGS